MYKILLLLVFVITSCTSSDKYIYISTDGSDNNNGSFNSPVLTIKMAQELARKYIDEGISNIYVEFMPGDYFFTETITFTEKDSQHNGSIIYKSYNNEKVNIYGGVKLTDWEKYNNNVYRLKLSPSFISKGLNVLIDDEEALPMSRYPNRGQGFGKELKVIDNTTLSIPDNWKNYDFSHAQVYGWLGADWFAELREVLSYDSNKMLLTVDPGSNFDCLNSRVYIQGVPELLDSEGEWCINYKDGYLYYWPLPDNRIEDSVIILPLQSRLLEIKGDYNNIIENITFKGLRFIGSNFSSSWRIFEKGEVGTMPKYLQEGLVYLENASNIQFKDCEIICAGHSGIYLNNRCDNCVVEGCHIKEAGFCGIYANSYFPGKEPLNVNENTYINKNHRFVNNYIHDCGKYVGGGCGIQLFQSGNNIISNNLIHEMPRYGISYKGVRNEVLIKELNDSNINFSNHFDYIHTRENFIAFNDIYNVCRSSFDFGAIESWGAGKGNIWFNNAIHDVDQAVDWDGWAHGLFTDDASDYTTIRNNIVYELKGGALTGGIMVKSVGQIVENNIFADNDIGRAMTMSPYIEPAADIVVKNNIIYRSGSKLYDVNNYSFSSDYFGLYDNLYNKTMVKNKKVFKEVDRNVIYPFYNQLDTLQIKGWDVNSNVIEPNFLKSNPQEAITYKDYRLPENSPVFNLGFQPIDYDNIGLLSDYKYETKKIRNIKRIIEAENYNRMKGVRPIAETGINKMSHGSWTRYDHVDFGDGKINRCKINLISPICENMNKKLIEIRVDSLSGKLIGEFYSSDNSINIKSIKGVHNLYLVFSNPIELDSFRFYSE